MVVAQITDLMMHIEVVFPQSERAKKRETMQSGGTHMVKNEKVLELGAGGTATRGLHVNK